MFKWSENKKRDAKDSKKIEINGGKRARIAKRATNTTRRSDRSNISFKGAGSDCAETQLIVEAHS